MQEITKDHIIKILGELNANFATYFADIRNAQTSEELKNIFNRTGFRSFGEQWIEVIYKYHEIYDSYNLQMTREEKINAFFETFKVVDVKKVAPKQVSPPAAPVIIPPVSNISDVVEDIDEDENTAISSKMTLKTLNAYCSNFALEERNSDIDTYAFTITNRLPINLHDNFKVKLKNTELAISTSLVVLFKLKENEIIAFGHLKQGENNEYNIIMDSANINFDAFGQQIIYRVGLFDALFDENDILNNNCCYVYTKEYRIKFAQLEETENVLCIDFGTSNTCAGTYQLKDTSKNEVETVLFANDTEKIPLYPTIVYVDDCSDVDDVKYIFGYEALAKVQQKDYDTMASVFFEIKRFVGLLEEDEEISDDDGNIAVVKKSDILKAYILHVIGLSEQYFKHKFKNLHFSSPVKLKRIFYKEFHKILGDYNILEPDKSLDEGIAIVYHSIKKIIDIDSKNKKNKLEKAKIMILDCGGGTTDLADCEFKYDKRDAATILNIDSTFINGNSDFGGNNITYRILQLIKIKLVKKYLKESYDENENDLLEIIPDDENTILNKYDEIRENVAAQNTKLDFKEFNKVIYKEFEKRYEECEEYIPTKFEEDGQTSVEDILRKKRNYYYLWQLAEKIKIKFYQEDIVKFDMTTEETNKKLKLNNATQHFYVRNKDNNELVSTTIEDISITIKEIHRLLCGDIYGLLNRIFDEIDFGKSDYTNYKLSGQSCKISLFMELLKEFIPGRKLRLNTHIAKENNDDSIRLKLDCIEGCIEYIRDIEDSTIDPQISIKPPKLIYNVEIERGSNKVLLNRDKEYSIDILTQGTKKVKLIIKNDIEIIVNRIDIEPHTYATSEVSLEQLAQDIARNCYLNDEANDIRELIVKINGIKPNESGKDGANTVLICFTLLSKEGYGINIYFLKKTSIDGYDRYEISEIYKNFEGDYTELFFDGSR